MAMRYFPSKFVFVCLFACFCFFVVFFFVLLDGDDVHPLNFFLFFLCVSLFSSVLLVFLFYFFFPHFFKCGEHLWHVR